MCLYVYIYICISVYIFIYLLVHMYLYTYIQCMYHRFYGQSGQDRILLSRREAPAVYWVAVKELDLSYRFMDIYQVVWFLDSGNLTSFQLPESRSHIITIHPFYGNLTKVP